MRVLRSAALWFATVGFAADAPRFEVASVRPSESRGREIIQAGPASLTMRNVRFRSCLRWAYHVSDYQVSGPAWIDDNRYEIVARSADAVSEEQLRSMLQTLLAERFKLLGGIVDLEPHPTAATSSDSSLSTGL